MQDTVTSGTKVLDDKVAIKYRYVNGVLFLDSVELLNKSVLAVDVANAITELETTLNGGGTK
jgi:hypothetical protein